MSREQIIRDTAYAIWEAEGRPEGRASEHWNQAEIQVAAIIRPAATLDAKAKPARSKAAPKPATPAKTAAKTKVSAP